LVATVYGVAATAFSTICCAPDRGRDVRLMLGVGVPC